VTISYEIPGLAIKTLTGTEIPKNTATHSDKQKNNRPDMEKSPDKKSRPQPTACAVNRGRDHQIASQDLRSPSDDWDA
jgi:hypothetical protein